MNKTSGGLHILLIPLIGFAIFAAAGAVVALIGEPEATPTEVIALTGPMSGGDWEIQKPELSDFKCGPDGRVISARITLNISGGVPPYYVRFSSEEAVLELLGLGIGFRLEGGSGVTAHVYDSQEGERNENSIDVYVPIHHSQCESGDPTDTPTATATPNDTATPMPSPTSYPKATPASRG